MSLSGVTSYTRRPALVSGVGALAAALVAGGYIWASRGDDGDRQVEVAKRGAEVMSFDLERTSHVFRPLDDGGVQTVVADDPNDSEQIALVRSHLEREAARFEQGDFDDPARVHGHEMPGLAELRAGAERVAVRYEPVAAGGRIRYVTRDPAIVRAIHEWFRAQVSDHGAHAEGES